MHQWENIKCGQHSKWEKCKKCITEDKLYNCVNMTFIKYSHWR